MHIITATFPDGGTVTHKILAHHVSGDYGWIAIVTHFRDAGIPFTHIFEE